MPLFGRRKPEPALAVVHMPRMPSDTAGGKGFLLGAAKVLGYDPKEVFETGRHHQPYPWQEEIWAYFDNVGEVNNTGRYIGNAMSRIILRPGWEDDDGKIVPLDEGTKDLPAEAKKYTKPVQDILRNLRGKSGGQSQLLNDLGINLSMPGECYLVHTDEVVGSAVQSRTWEVLSIDELRPQADGKNYLRYRGMGWKPETLGPDSHPIRVWIKHPRYSEEPMSAIRPLLDGVEELVLLRREVRGQTLSILMGPGVFLIPQEITWPDDPSKGESESGNPLQFLLGTAMGAAIQDKGSPNAQVPLVIDVPGELIDKFRHIDFRSPADAVTIQKRNEALLAYARGAPLPVEVTTGMMSTTFTNAGQIDEDTYKAYLEPFARGAIDSIVVGYLHPQLMIATGMNPQSTPPDVMRRVTIYADLSELLAPKDTVQQTLDAWDRYLICNAAACRELGFSEDDIPSDDEILARVRIKQQGNSRETLRGLVSTSAEDSLIVDDPNPSTSRPATKELPPPEGQLPSKKPVDPAARPEEPEPPAALPPGQAPAAEVEVSGVATPAAAVSSTSEGTQASAVRNLALQVQSAVDYGVQRALSQAGARLKNKTNGRAEPDIRAALAQAEKHLVASILGPAEVARLLPGGELGELFGAEFATLRSVVTAAATRWQHPDPAGVAERAVELAERIGRGRITDPGLQPAPDQIARVVTGG